jgi:hypothetical protein
MSAASFKEGSAYIGTATIDHRRQKIFSVIARRGSVVSVAHTKDVRRETVESCDGAEIVKVRDSDGFDYVLSARVGVDIDKAFNVVRMCQGES